MVKAYRHIQQWNSWLGQPQGGYLVEAERQLLPSLLAEYYGKYIALIGVPEQQSLLTTSNMMYPFLISPMVIQVRSGARSESAYYIESEFYELSIHSSSIDLVILPHTLEYVDNPRRILAEACRIVKPEGHIVIFGFNPYSLWGLKKLLLQNKYAPWSSNFIQATTVKQWLKLADFELVKQTTMVFRPPIQHDGIYQKLKFLEGIGKRCYAPFGGVYAIVATAKNIPFTPIRMHWKQKLSLQKSTIPRPTTIRNSS